jgi:DNA repair protein RecO (recombination protein O)
LRPLRSYRVLGLVLRIRNLGEADRLLTILSAERGKISALAKGARRARSKLAALQLFAQADLQLAAGANLEIVTQAVIQQSFFNLHTDFARFSYASYFAELADVLSEAGAANLRLFELLQSAFVLLDNGVDPEMLARIFELRLLDLSGYNPEFEECVSCGNTLGTEPMAFTPIQGGVICTRCVGGRRGLMPVSEATRQTLLAIRDLPDIDNLPPALLSLAPAIRREMRTLLRAHLEYHLERALKSIDMIKQLERQQ